MEDLVIQLAIAIFALGWYPCGCRCPCCSEIDMNSPTGRPEMKVTITGFTDKDCTGCSVYNATFAGLAISQPGDTESECNNWLCNFTSEDASSCCAWGDAIIPGTKVNASGGPPEICVDAQGRLLLHNRNCDTDCSPAKRYWIVEITSFGQSDAGIGGTEAYYLRSDPCDACEFDCRDASLNVSCQGDAIGTTCSSGVSGEACDPSAALATIEFDPP